ncbi:adhesion G protein-coupled receptor L4-like [Stylophora pistillata]|uniref:adhesion G protein-coupled receptor L4-like n=1 Tax=Stylophora pistillata TaxID=50429 RepID=UPI000C04B693|nr:adhesion G protein-coupled receptor L4-like [Stylophora pistillata]
MYIMMVNGPAFNICLKSGRVSRSERIFLHKNLLVSLALGQVVYIVDIKILTLMKKHQIMCSIYAVIQHYLHTSLYTWMLVEGINLYLKMVSQE